MLKKPHTFALVVAVVMLLCPLAMGASSPSVRVCDLERIAQDYNVSEDFLYEIRGGDEITVDKLKSYAKEYKLPAQYLQRFLTDSFVFKMGSDFEYIPVDPSLKQNAYNWDCLSSDSWDKYYQGDELHTAVKVIDVSSHQGTINWERVKADGVDYAFIRLGYTGYATGKMNVDARYQENMRNAQAAGVKVGVYYYSQAIDRWEAAEEAQLVLDNLRGYTLDLPVVFDVEGAPARSARTNGLSSQRYTNIINSFMGTVQNAGHEVMLYSYCKFLLSNLDMTQLSDYPLWLAQYYQVPFFPYDFEIWQHSPKGWVDGIAKDVDINLMFIKTPPVVEALSAEGQEEATLAG